MTSSSAIDVRGLTKRFSGRTVVDHVDLAVGEGRICGFLGPNGSGKTTTLRMICGLSIRENLECIARVFALDRRPARVDEALERLGLLTRASQLAGQLSGGWKQRLALAAAVLHEPRILLLDEPTAGVDPQARREFWDQIHALSGEGMTVLVSTHYMDEAERCHKIAYIAYGHMLARGTMDEVIASSHLYALQGEGPGADRLAAQIEGRPGISMAAPFGNALHVCGHDPAALRKAVEPWATKFSWREADPTLEDVFIHLMNGAADNSVTLGS